MNVGETSCGWDRGTALILDLLRARTAGTRFALFASKPKNPRQGLPQDLKCKRRLFYATLFPSLLAWNKIVNLLKTQWFFSIGTTTSLKRTVQGITSRDMSWIETVEYEAYCILMKQSHYWTGYAIHFVANFFSNLRIAVLKMTVVGCRWISHEMSVALTELSVALSFAQFAQEKV